ncbi:MAG TPA: DUF429 domain-containing protein [Acetobacteraceae bacterium]|nr:DUF429 domain-containing protein [Acetobacteraceae bacterium]
MGRVSPARRPVYVGIDVACATSKRLPVCFVAAGPPLLPLTVPRHLSDRIPCGLGNQEIAADAPFRQAAHAVAKAIHGIADDRGWRIIRAAIDAPAAPSIAGTRACEAAIRQGGMSVFQTPTAAAWETIRARCRAHLADGGSAAALPNANRIWMLFGFELFASLRAWLDAEIIEVYPHAIVRALLTTCGHKSTEAGYQAQLDAVSARTGWSPDALAARLKRSVPGTRDDRLDAFMCAWVASLLARQRRAYGSAGDPHDAIWVPI